MNDFWRLSQNPYLSTLTNPKMRKLTPDENLTLKLTNDGWTNLHEWVEIIVEDYITKQDI